MQHFETHQNCYLTFVLLVSGSKESRPASFLSSLSGTPRLTPPGSPPRRHSISVATTRNIFDDRSSIFSSLPSSHQSSVSSPFDPVSQTGRFLNFLKICHCTSVGFLHMLLATVGCQVSMLQGEVIDLQHSIDSL